MSDYCVNCGTPVELVEDDYWEHTEECPEDTPCYDGTSSWVGPERP